MTPDFNIKPIATEAATIVRDVIRELALNKEIIKVTPRCSENFALLVIDSDPTDSGRIIGGKGLHFKSLLLFAGCVGLKHACAIEIENLRERTRKVLRYENFAGRDDWPKEKIVNLAKRMVCAAVTHSAAVTVETTDNPGHNTTLTVYVANRENTTIVESMMIGILNADGSRTGWLRVLFNAIGKANGRNITVIVKADQECDPPQPESARGRFAPEMK